MKIINSHVHLEDINLLDFMNKILSEYGISKMCILSYAKHQLINANVIALAAKLRYPNDIYAFGGLDYSSIMTMGRDKARKQLVKQLEDLIDIGFDGIKFLDLKPTEFIKIRYKLDDPIFEPFFSLLQDSGMPLVMHIADPEYFWDSEKVPDWAKSLGWFYNSKEYPSFKEIYQVLTNILKKFPMLKLTLAHFGFMQADLKHLGKLLDYYPSLSIDLTPGRCVYADLHSNLKQTRLFFEKYQDRIIFGTDLELGALKEEDSCFTLQDTIDNIKIAQTFIDSSEYFPVKIEDGSVQQIKGLGLNNTIKAKIYHKNFEKLVASAPCSVDVQMLCQELLRVKSHLSRLKGKQRNHFMKQVLHIITTLKKEFAR